MNFVTVDNDGNRLSALTVLLKETFPDCTVTEFSDPLMSAKYIINNEVDSVLAAENMRPADGENLRHVIEVNKPQVKVILLSEPRGHHETKNQEELSITREQLKFILK